MKGGNMNRYALIVGYGGSKGEAIAGDNNARAMKKVTQQAGFETLLLINKDNQATMGGLQWLRDHTNEESTVVFFYSGHGPTPSGFSIGSFCNAWNDIKCAKLVSIHEGCYSGRVIADADADYTGTVAYTMTAPDRIIVTSHAVDRIGYSLPNKSGFGELFVKEGLGTGMSVQAAFAHYNLTAHEGLMSDSMDGPFYL